MNNNYVVVKVTPDKGKDYEVVLKNEQDDLVTLKVHEEIVLKYRLVLGKELESHTLDEVNSKLDLGKAYQYALNVLSRKSYTVEEMRQKFLTKQYGVEMIDELIQRLCDVNLLNDETYTMGYVTQAVTSGKKGPKLLARELSKKGVSTDLISKYMPMYSEEQQLDCAVKLAQQQFKSNTKYGPHFLKQKIFQSLVLKGFSKITVEKAIQSLTFEEEFDVNPILKKEMEKLFRKHHRLDGFDKKMKISQALVRKGFSFDEINELYAELKESYEEE